LYTCTVRGDAFSVPLKYIHCFAAQEACRPFDAS
jgi:hypothetical protein